MTDVVTWTSAAHTVYLDPMTGVGMLVMPHPEADMSVPWAPESLHAADWSAVVAHLRSHGWEPLDGEDGGGWVTEGFTPDGREVIALLGLDPITADPCLERLAEAGSVLAETAGVAR